MKDIKNNLRSGILLGATMLAAMFAACTPDDMEPELGPKPEAEFTVSAIPDMPNTYLLSADVDAYMYQWDKGNGSGFVKGNKTDTAFYENKGEYLVQLRVFDAGGHTTVEQTISVEEDIQSGGVDLVAGGDMSSDEFWHVYGTGSTLTTTEFTEEGLRLSNEGEAAQTNVLVWQALEIEAGKGYKLSAKVSGSGANNSWLEVYLNDDEPVEGSDYSTGGVIGLSTWDGCATSEFSGNLIDIGCWNGGAEKGKDGVVQFEESGTVYLIIKAGSWDGTLGEEGITITEVKLVETGDDGSGEDGGGEDKEYTEGDDLIREGSMSSDAHWTVFNPGGAAQASTEFTDNGLVFTNSPEEDSNVGVYQAVEVEAGQLYRFSAQVKGSGATNTWFEIYFGETEPVDGTDYADGAYTGLNTWGGCGTEAFEGNIAVLGCNDAPGTGEEGMISFEESGTIYLVIKTGSNGGGSLGTDGITLSEVKLVELN